MCHRVACPNDGKPTWWGCGGHIEQALAGVPVSARCSCPHERIPYLPMMQRVKAVATHVSAGASDDADLGLAVVTSGTQHVLTITSKKDACSVTFELDLPAGITAGEADATVSISPPATAVEVPIALADASTAATVLGPGAGTLRRQWTCDGVVGEMEDVHARLVLAPPKAAGFGLGGIEPTYVVALVVLAWVAYNFFSAGGGGREKRD
jgi:hypothetical protein